jgi:hypothetical protein
MKLSPEGAKAFAAAAKVRADAARARRHPSPAVKTPALRRVPGAGSEPELTEPSQ